MHTHGGLCYHTVRTTDAFRIQLSVSLSVNRVHCSDTQQVYVVVAEGCFLIFNTRSVIMSRRKRLSTTTMSCVVSVTSYFTESFDSLSSRGQP